MVKMHMIRIKGPFAGESWPQAGGYAQIAEYLNKLGYKTDKYYLSFGSLMFIVSEEDEMAYRLKYGNGQPDMWWTNDKR